MHLRHTTALATLLCSFAIGPHVEELSALYSELDALFQSLEDLK